jgi:hypothetical protein
MFANEDVRPITSESDLVALLRELSRECLTDRPTIATIDGLHGYDVCFGFANGMAFVHLIPEGGLPPYLITVGD